MQAEAATQMDRVMTDPIGNAPLWKNRLTSKTFLGIIRTTGPIENHVRFETNTYVFDVNFSPPPSLPN
jgi:hypothetical protein